MSRTFQWTPGWLGIDETQKFIARQFGTLTETAPQLMQAPVPEDKPILLYKAWTDIFADYPPWAPETIGDCLDPNSIVLGETVKMIKDVQVGDRVWTGQGKLARVVTTRSLQTMKPMVKISPTGGLPITCTADHKFLVYRVPVVAGKRVTGSYYERCVNGGIRQKAAMALYEAMQPEWVPAGELTENDYLLSPVRHESIPMPDDEFLAKVWETPAGRRMLGYFLGDGSANGGSAEFCVSEPDIAAELVETLTGFGFDPKVDGGGRKTNSARIRVHSKDLVEWLRGYFYDADKVKVFPSWAIGDEAFVDGLFEADGCNQTSHRAVTSTSPSIVHGLMASLRNMGFNPTVGTVSRSKGTYANAKSLYQIRWTDSPERNQIWRDEEYVCHRIRSLEFIEGPATVYDIGIEDEHHSFIANGFACHNCVSHGHSHGNDLLECIEIVMGIQGGPRTAADVQETDSEFIYGESRKVAGILGRQDGSYGAAAVKAMMTVGMVSRQMLGANGAYSGDRAKQWGLSGPPADVEKMAGAYKLGNAALVGSWDELVAALYDGKPVTECSNWLPDGKRDKDGFGGNGGRGGHCQLICGVRFDIPGAFILNNWPLDFYSGPIGLGAPPGGQWVPKSTIEDILSEGDSWALSASPSFGSGSTGIHAPLPTSWRHA